MSAAGMGTGSCRPGPSSGVASGACNPRKFSEKIALHNQRLAEETAAFQEVMLDITSTRIQAQKERLAQSQGPCYGGSLPNVNQIGRTNPEFQGQLLSDISSTRQTRHHGLVERVQRDRRTMLSGTPYKRRRDCLPYSPDSLAPASNLSWRRHWPSSVLMDKSHALGLPGVTLNRTNSDSALHTSVMNPNPGLHGGPGHALSQQNRCSMFPYPVPPIEEHVLDEENLLKSWDAKKIPVPSNRPKSCEVPGINILPSPAQPSGAPLNPTTLSTGGSLPDLTNLRFPSLLPAQKDEPGYTSLSGGGSTGNLAATLTQLGITTGSGFNLPGLSMPLQGTFSNSMLQSSLSHPNIQSSLSCHSSHGSLSSTSLQSSLSNPSLQSSLSSSPSLPSSLSNQSLHSSLSNSSLSGKSFQSAASNPSFSSGIGGSGSCSSSSSFSSLLAGQQGPSLTTSPRRRNQLSPLKLSVGTESRWHPTKQFSPTMSPTLSAITQGVALDTSKLLADQRLPSYPYGQVQAAHPCPQAAQQSAHPGTTVTHLQYPDQEHHHQLQHHKEQHEHEQHRQQPVRQPDPHQSGQQEHQHLEQYPQRSGPHDASQRRQWQPFQQQPQNQLQIHGQCRGMEQQCHLQGIHRFPQALSLDMGSSENLPNTRGRPSESASQQRLNPIQGPLSRPSSSIQNLQESLDQLLPSSPNPSISRSLSANLDLQNDSLLSSLLDEPFVDLQLQGRQGQELSQQLRRFCTEAPDGVQSFSQRSGSETGKERSEPVGSHCSGIHQLLDQQTQSHIFSEGCHKSPSILLSENSTPALSKDITCTLSGMPGFEVDPFGLDDPLRMDPQVLEGLGLLEDGELVLADPSVEDSFRSERFQ